MGTIQPSSSDGPFYAGRSKPPPTKPRHTVQWEYSQANLHEQDAEQQVLASLSNQKPEIVQYSVPEVKLPRGQVPHKPHHASDLSSVSEEIKPIVDVVLRVIKRKTVTIPTANNAKKSADKDSTIHTYPGHPTTTQVSQESLNKSVSVSHEVQSGRNNSSENYTLADTVTNNSPKEQKSKLQPHAALQPSDLPTTGEIASKLVQLLVDTGACVSAIYEQFVHKTYGQFLPKMTNGSLTSVQTISGDKVPVLGKISVPLKLNGFEYSCGFHVMKNLAYDAILGRDFLQRHQARIDFETNSLTFKGSTDVRKKRESTSVSELPVMGTYHSAMTNVETEASTESDPQPCPKVSYQKTVKRSTKNDKIFSQYLALFCILLYLLAASHKHDDMPVINKPVTQTTHKVCAYQVGGSDSVHSGASFQSTPTNHKEPYKIEQDEDQSQKPRSSLKPSTKAIEIHQ